MTSLPYTSHTKLTKLPTHSQTYNAINQLALTNISSHLNSHHKKTSPPNNKTYCRHLTNQSSPNTSWHHSPHTYHSKILTPTQKPPFTLITQLNHLLHSHQHIITLISHHKNFSPLNLQNTPKHNPSLSNPNLINYRTLSNAASPSYHITKSLTTQPTKHTTKSPTSHLPPQTYNTHQNISPHSHNTTQSTTTLLATYHHPISPKNLSSLDPQNLLTYNSIKNSTTHTAQTN